MAGFTQKTNPYKHLSGRETTLLTHLQPATPSIAASDAFYAVPYKSGGGGPVFIGRLDQTSKVEPAEALSHCIQGHKAEVKAVAFSPFHSALLATGGEDCRVRVAADVADPLKESLEVGAHGSGVRCLAFHPAAEHVLLSAAADGSWATWDVASELGRAAEIHSGKLDAAITHVDWHRSTFAASCSFPASCVFRLREMCATPRGPPRGDGVHRPPSPRYAASTLSIHAGGERSSRRSSSRSSRTSWAAPR